MSAPVLRPVGDAALLVEFEGEGAAALLARIHALDATLRADPLPGVIEAVPSYRAILLHLDPLAADLAALGATVLRLAAEARAEAARGSVWDVPVAYGGPHGADLDHVARRTGLMADEVIARHAATEYLVAMVGFLPGFAYLSGLDPRLAVPRRPDPRQRIPASSVSIGGSQTAIGSLEGPSGWHLIGRSPVRPFQPGRAPEFLFAPADRIRFRPVSAAEWDRLDALAAQGRPIATRLGA